MKLYYLVQKIVPEIFCYTIDATLKIKFLYKTKLNFNDIVFFLSMTTNQFKVELWYKIRCLTHLVKYQSKIT